MYKNLVSTYLHLLHCNLKVIIVAIIIDSLWGDPKTIYKKIPHPIIWIGTLIHKLDHHLNHHNDPSFIQKRNGFFALAIATFIPMIIGTILQKILFKILPKSIAILICAFITSIFIAKRSLYEHVKAVETPLHTQNIPAARIAVSQIVGRKTDHLDQSGICRAAIESLAENFSDGVIAPIFWGCVGGLPGIIAYKAINTADSMIGHKTAKYLYFGYAAAKTDDYINYPASRLSALWITLAVKRNLIKTIKKIKKEAKKHNSPNAGWPEAAMALGLSIQLGGPRQYKEGTVDTDWIGNGRKILSYQDIKNALRVFQISCRFNLLCILFIYFSIKINIK
ncbi:adenosylcobinamide-phosphate synthase CbiB [Commensalibacter oyaizuii]|uniref:Cobalamin biosynthesis protein CobD n=1 Tax=Commensalibacter oyaizuii TaxID=3043873 RepID=A0ABT6Q1D4_9PROT|nr:adenosylcobinamide-phosphate synthase CbiB [Commensalibacter sp. TBRC 16381]MDI2090917.1 adenosylcobinamide-phosphate synthase CbiB [Commensalibacter sp. TBRC 16381]